jgi:5-oxoprolinase (ATP-hydrolysing)
MAVPTSKPAADGQDQGIRIAIDRGGTFTDAWAQIPGREQIVFKILSVCPEEYDDAPTECIRQILEIATDTTIPKGSLLDLEPIESIRMGTTVATNALLERKGDRVAFLTTKGFRDGLRIGNQTRPDLFDLSVRRLEQLYETVVEGEFSPCWVPDLEALLTPPNS